jgi:hypothetical protein
MVQVFHGNVSEKGSDKEIVMKAVPEQLDLDSAFSSSSLAPLIFIFILVFFFFFCYHHLLIPEVDHTL